MINVPATAQKLSDDYAKLGSWIGLASVDGSDPTGKPLEVPAGAGGYARVQTTWSSEGGGVNVGSAVTISAPEGEYNFVVLRSESDPSQDGDALIDWTQIDATLNNDGQIVVVPTYTQS